MKIKYRAEIDGLRALAVISVIFYHLNIYFFNFKFFQGGFLGVDIFFVISGYLITSILLREYYEKNRISLKDFYQRRARRILPALLVVIIASCVISFFLLFPSSLIKFSKSVIYSLSYVSNFFFWYSQTVYGAESSFLSPLIHTWSLSVEEQFYIIYPILLIFILRFFNNRLFIFLAIFFISSLFMSAVGAKYVPSFNFFVLPTRTWELISGALIAYLELNRKKISYKKNFFSIFGLCLIIFSFFYFKKELDHPSILTLVPILGTCLIIYFANNNENYVKNLLSKKFFVSIGLISYSLYLWHFPILSFSKHLGIYDNFTAKICLIFLTFVLSILSYLYIETYFRDKKIPLIKLIKFIFSFIIILLFFSFLILKFDGFPNRVNKNLSKFQIEFLNQKRDTLKKFNADKKINSKNVMILGDSHAQILFTSLSINKKFNQKYNFSLLRGGISCMEKSIKKQRQLCGRKLWLNLELKTRFRKSVKNFYESELIIIKTRWSDKDVESLDSLITFLKKQNKRIIIISSNPEFNFNKKNKSDHKFKGILIKILFNNSDYIDRFILVNDRLPNDIEEIEINKNYFKSLKPEIINRDKLIEKIASENKVPFVDFKKFLCDYKKQTCKDLTNTKKKVFIDFFGHISTEASRETSDEFFKTGLM